MRLPSLAGHQGARRGLIAWLPALVGLALVGCERNEEKAIPIATQTSALKMAETPCKNGDPAQVARDFYTRISTDAASGLPSVESMSTLAPLMTSSLRTAIDKARARQEAFIAAHPGEKPPFAEGSLFTSLFEGPTGIESAATRLHGDTASVAVGFVYAEQGTETFRWEDEMLLRCEQGRWRLDDVRYGGDWDFASNGQLKHALESE